MISTLGCPHTRKSVLKIALIGAHRLILTLTSTMCGNLPSKPCSILDDLVNMMKKAFPRSMKSGGKERLQLVTKKARGKHEAGQAQIKHEATPFLPG